MHIKIVFFDALHTIVKPRLPIHIQYAQVFSPHFAVDPLEIKGAFKIGMLLAAALKQVQVERPAYVSNDPQSAKRAENWWSEVIRRTAIGAGADSQTVDEALGDIVPTLLHRFSSKEGYALYEDTIPTLQTLQVKGIRTGLISNTDSRMRLALEDLGILSMLSPTLFSEEEGIEKPSPEIWHRALNRAGLDASQAMHVGDEINSDYHGPKQAGLYAVLLRRPPEPVETTEEPIEDTISSLAELPGLIDKMEGSGEPVMSHVERAR